MLPRAGNQRPVFGQLAFAAAQGFFVERGWAQIPGNVAGADYAQGFQAVGPLNLYRHLLLAPRVLSRKKEPIVPYIVESVNVSGPQPVILNENPGARRSDAPFHRPGQPCPLE